MRTPNTIVFRVTTPSVSQLNLPSIQSGVSAYSLQSYLRDRVREVFEESNLENWDHEGASAVSLIAVLAVEKIAETLPPLAQPPAVFAQHNGRISLQWLSKDKAKDAVVVSVDKNGSITYAMSCANGKKAHGSEVFSGTAPRDVVECVLHRFVEPDQKATRLARG
jgi:hypothetical protein